MKKLLNRIKAAKLFNPQGRENGFVAVIEWDENNQAVITGMFRGERTVLNLDYMIAQGWRFFKDYVEIPPSELVKINNY